MKSILSIARENKRVLIIILSLEAIFLTYIFFGCTYSFSTGSWGSYFPGPKWKRAVLESICTIGGGLSEYNVVDLGSKTTYSCIKPFSDYGDPCEGSNDCEGECEQVGPIPQFCYKVDEFEYKCAKKTKGTCSPRSYNVFDKWKEVLENKIVVHEGGIM